jgi:hypothetical protein
MQKINMSLLRFDMTRAGLKLQKYSPEILLGAGLIGMLATIVLASKAALKVEGIVNEAQVELDSIEVATIDKNNDAYTEQDSKKDIVKVYVNSGVKFAKLYGPTISVGLASTACILASRGIMAHRNAVLVSAYNLLSEGYKNYRQRVVDEFGEEKDRMYHLGFEEKIETETTTDEEGKKVKNKVRKLESIGKQIPSIYARFFDESSTEWRTDRNLNAFFLRTVQTHCNDKFKAKGHMFLNEVYDDLGIPRSLEGQMVGWVYSKDNPVGDNYIDFGIFDAKNPASRDFVNGYNPSVLLDFNVDGIMATLI